MAKREYMSTRLRFKVFHRDNFTCTYCGRKAPEVVLHVDHVRSVYDGGSNHIDNLATACSDCNLGKGRHSVYKPKPEYGLTADMQRVLAALDEAHWATVDCELSDVTEAMEQDYDAVADAMYPIYAAAHIDDCEELSSAAH